MTVAYINFHAPINQSTVQLMATCGQLLKEGKNELYLMLSTPGGRVDSGVTSYNFLKDVMPVWRGFAGPFLQRGAIGRDSLLQLPLQAWLTLPSCFASSSTPTLARIIFWSLVILVSSGNAMAGAAQPRLRVRAPFVVTLRRTFHCQIKTSGLNRSTPWRRLRCRFAAVRQFASDRN
jgi:hypothetical protein